LLSNIGSSAAEMSYSLNGWREDALGMTSLIATTHLSAATRYVWPCVFAILSNIASAAA
jgi:hypothetical protein